MFKSKNLIQTDEETFKYRINSNKDFKILQLTDIHFGFGIFSAKNDEQAMMSIRKIIRKSKPDMIVITGDTVFPYFPKAGTLNNRKQVNKFTEFMDGFKIPYAVVLGNHDAEMFAFCSRKNILEVYKKGKYCICTRGRKKLSGIGNYVIELVDEHGKLIMPLVMIDSNMYAGKTFFGPFDFIHDDQTEWCMEKLEHLKNKFKNVNALAFFHIPPYEMRIAYEKMKLGDKSVKYHFGSVSERDEHFGVSNVKSDFFEKAVENGCIKGMFFGHDHLNTVSLTYKGIRMTYGMSIDCLGYTDIHKSYIQRGGTLITIKKDKTFDVDMVPCDRIISKYIHGIKKECQD